jgi:hypothetical protein
MMLRAKPNEPFMSKWKKDEIEGFIYTR